MVPVSFVPQTTIAERNAIDLRVTWPQGKRYTKTYTANLQYRDMQIIGDPFRELKCIEY